MMKSVDKELYDFYQTFIADEGISAFQSELVEKVLGVWPKTILDFGCNTGNVMQYILSREPEVQIQGFDFSKGAIQKARAKGLDVHWGSDIMVSVMVDAVDVSYTSSVLSHIPEIASIINVLKAVTTKRIVLAETNEKKGKYYFPHDYESYGFRLDRIVKNKYLVDYGIYVLDK